MEHNQVKRKAQRSPQRNQERRTQEKKGEEGKGRNDIPMTEEERKEILDDLKEELNYHQIVWYDGERYQLYGSKQELYRFLYELRKKL